MGRKKLGDKSELKEVIFAFRVTPAEKHQLNLLAEKAHFQLNSRRKLGDPARDKSEVIAEALAKGLKAL